MCCSSSKTSKAFTLGQVRLIRLADYLDWFVPNNRFELGLFASGELKNQCGTVGCAAGWGTNIFSTDGLILVPSSNGTKDMMVKLDSNPNLDCVEAISEFFGISKKEAYCVFYGAGYLSIKTTKELVVKRLRALANGCCADQLREII